MPIWFQWKSGAKVYVETKRWRNIAWKNEDLRLLSYQLNHVLQFRIRSRTIWQSSQNGLRTSAIYRESVDYVHCLVAFGRCWTYAFTVCCTRIYTAPVSNWWLVCAIQYVAIIYIQLLGVTYSKLMSLSVKIDCRSWRHASNKNVTISTLWWLSVTAIFRVYGVKCIQIKFAFKARGFVMWL